MDFPISQAVPLNLLANRYKDRVGGEAGSLITAIEFINPTFDELIGLQTAAGLVATEGDNTQVAAAVNILARGGALGFRVKPQDPLSLSVDIEAGAFFSRATGLMVSVAATNAGPIAAPGADPRNDIVYIDALTGAVGIVTGAENAAPVDPALPAGTVPVKRIKAYVGMTEIDAADLEEHRYLGSAGASAPAFTKSYESTGQAITSAGSLTLAHGMGIKPKMIDLWLKCLTAEEGYSIGDELHMTTDEYNLSGGVSLVRDATNLNIRYGGVASVFAHINKTTGVAFSLTNSNWEMYLAAFA